MKSEIISQHSEIGQWYYLCDMISSNMPNPWMRIGHSNMLHVNGVFMSLEGAKQPISLHVQYKTDCLYNKSHEFIVHTMHGMLFISEKCRQCPEGILQEKKKLIAQGNSDTCPAKFHLCYKLFIVESIHVHIQLAYLFGYKTHPKLSNWIMLPVVYKPKISVKHLVIRRTINLRKNISHNMLLNFLIGIYNCFPSGKGSCWGSCWLHATQDKQETRSFAAH